MTELTSHIHSLVGLRVLDLGCGEGKNAAYLAQRGALVDAVDSSKLAINNAQNAWPDVPNITWRAADVRCLTITPETYDIVLAYGFFHCLSSFSEVAVVAGTMRNATVKGGFNVVCSFNDRAQDLAAAHPGFTPTLLKHTQYEELYLDWLLIHSTDTDLHETHPHNNIPHSHSMTRLIARKP